MTTHKKDDFEKNLKKHFSDAKSTFKDVKHPGKIDISNELKSALEIIKLNKKEMHKVAVRKEATTTSLIFIAAAALAVYLGLYLAISKQLALIGFKFPIGDLLISAVLYIVLYIFMVFVFDFISNQFFKGKGDFGQLLRVLGYGNLVTVAGIIAFLSPFAAIWSLVVSFVALQEVKKMETINVIITIIIGSVVAGLVSYVLGLIIGYSPMEVFSAAQHLY